MDGNLVGCVMFHVWDGSHGRRFGCRIRICTSLSCQHYPGVVVRCGSLWLPSFTNDTSWVDGWNAYATDVVGAENSILGYESGRRFVTSKYPMYKYKHIK